MRQVCDDPCHDDQRDAVADASRCDLLAEPHQEDGAASQGHHRDQSKEQSGVNNRGLGVGAHALESARDPVGLDSREQDRTEPRVLVQLLAPALTLFLERLERGRNRGQQLDDDRGRDVRHDV